MNDIKKKLLILNDFVINSIKEPSLIEGNYLVFSSENQLVEDSLNENEFKFDLFDSNEYTVNLENIADVIGVFLNEEDLRQRAEEVIDLKSFLPLKSIAVLDYGKELLFYDFHTKITYIGNEEIENYFIENLCEYIKLISKINNDEFLDYFDTLNSEGVVYTSSKGVLKLGFPLYPIVMDDKKSIKKDVERVLTKLDNDKFKLHFKNQLFELKKEENQTTISSIISHLDSLYQQADNNYQLELKNFSFEKLKTDLQKEKEKYFTSLREILNKVLSQVMGAPISIGASVFASYKVENNYILGVILLAFIIYAGFAIYFQYIYREDVLEIESDFYSDFTKILDKSGLSQIEVNKEKVKIERRLRTIKRTIVLFITLIVILVIMFAGYIVSQMLNKKIEDTSKTINLKAEQIVITLSDSTNKDSLANTIKIIANIDFTKKDTINNKELLNIPSAKK